MLYGVSWKKRNSQKTIKVKCQFIFNGYFEVVAENMKEAKRKVSENCGCSLSQGIHTSDSDVVDWDFPTGANQIIKTQK